uniref:Uncharacterized protein n=1 Tax=Lactuca sativa TaxID=4236 RepID=A0A9R1WLK7_LACSA|nr:hypothetical protein LSAT_V11C100010320 [Lactuca sativa]
MMVDEVKGDDDTVNNIIIKKKKRVFFLDVNPICYDGSTPSLHSFAHWIFLFFSEVSLTDPVIVAAVVLYPFNKCDPLSNLRLSKYTLSLDDVTHEKIELLNILFIGCILGDEADGVPRIQHLVPGMLTLGYMKSGCIRDTNRTIQKLYQASLIYWGKLVVPKLTGFISSPCETFSALGVPVHHDVYQIRASHIPPRKLVY